MVPRAQYLAVLLFLYSPALHGVTLSATVKDPSGGLVVGAAVSVEGKLLPAPLLSITDAWGLARFDQVAAGLYRVTVAKEKFEVWERTVTVGDKPIELSVALKPKVLTTSVQVTGRRSPLANSDPNYRSLRDSRGRVSVSALGTARGQTLLRL